MMCGITGTPGTGKSMIGDELARRGHRVVHLTDTVGPYVTGDDEKRDVQIIDVDRWAAEFRPVDGFVEGHFAHLLPCDKVIVLRCRPDELKARLAQRKYRASKIRENAEAEALDSCLIETVEDYDPATIFELDTTGRDAPYCADRIEQFVKGEIPADYGHIDWTSFLEVGP
ncbi:adenylate kinase family protein [Methanoregula sp.]|uniref:adenylate kinase family protein n=1 Tax=Methanoregula sp. TaxID=2052170 RepID=UPI00236B18E2|nr:adenylate kinase family protein [Methanoregula sp.]MDD1686541.1 adenylate kinase family protein [Methanoregula sp.]